MQQPVQITPAQATASVAKPFAKPAQLRKRHMGLFMSFMLLVLVPTAVSFAYLITRASDQYASTLGFSVRTEDTKSAVDILGGLGGFSTGSSSDTDILFEYIQSQQMVQKVDSYLDLREMYSRPQEDFIFRYGPQGTIEDLVKYWNRMVQVFYDAGHGMIEIRVKAFTADDAQKIGNAIISESTLVINELTEIARLDTTNYALDGLTKTQGALREIRQELTRFRIINNIIDPNMEIGVQTGLLNALQKQYSDALIELDLLRETTREADPRISQARRKIEVIEERITDERRKFGTSGGLGVNGQNLTNLVSEFERLSVDLTFAEQAYLAARTSYEAKLADAERQSRYLAPHIRPTLAESPQFPRRFLTTGVVFVLCLLGWSVLCLIYYSIKDRR